MDRGRSRVAYLVELERIMLNCFCFLTVMAHYIMTRRRHRRYKHGQQGAISYNMSSRLPRQVSNLSSIVEVSDVACVNNLRMSRNAFGRLCELLSSMGGLVASRHVGVPEQVAMFLSVIAHHKKNRIIGHNFVRSGRTVSKYVKDVLHAIIKIYPVFIAAATPVTEECDSDRWKAFKGCLGALDGTYIPVRVWTSDKPRYRNRKGEISVNILAVCNREMNFTYILTGWEGSAADSRVLRDAVSRPGGLMVPRGCYYLCDNGYANSEGFLSPYKGVRYHLREWSNDALAPRNKEELFNMRHSRARSVIERAFGAVKGRWAILRSPSWYPIKIHNRLVMACCLLHNYIRREMDVDPLGVDDWGVEVGEENGEAEFVDCIGASQQWNDQRDRIAASMYQDWIST